MSTLIVICVSRPSCWADLLPEKFQHIVHAFLLDSGRPNAPIAELGGTGRSHDWGISAEFVKRSTKPVFAPAMMLGDRCADFILRNL